MSLGSIAAVVLGFAAMRALSPFELGSSGADAWSLTLDLVVVLGFVAAVLGFERGDPPRLGWIFTLISQLGILGGHWMRVVELPFEPAIVLANVAWIISILLWLETSAAPCSRRIGRGVHV